MIQPKPSAWTDAAFAEVFHGQLKKLSTLTHDQRDKISASMQTYAQGRARGLQAPPADPVAAISGFANDSGDPVLDAQRYLMSLNLAPSDVPAWIPEPVQRTPKAHAAQQCMFEDEATPQLA